MFLGKIKVLQIGLPSVLDVCDLPEDIECVCIESLEELAEIEDSIAPNTLTGHTANKRKKEQDVFDIYILMRKLNDEECEKIFPDIKAYSLFVHDEINLQGRMLELFRARMGRQMKREELVYFLQNDARNFFSKSYGEKLPISNIAIAKNFKGEVTWNGNCGVELVGDFSAEMDQIAYYRPTIPVFLGQAIDLWFEYETEGDVEVALKVVLYKQGTLATPLQTWFFTEEELKDIVTFDNQIASGNVFFSIYARGKGTLNIYTMSDRYSRRGYGSFLPGGERVVTSKREEIFFYFDPGDMKPPLNIFYSGFKTKQGFEGYNMLRRLGAPFVMIAETRLDGGSFYMGDEEYESLMKERIQHYLDELGFGPDQMIMAGISMGTTGALYYGCDFGPRAILLGKPLASIGNIASYEKHFRPGGFATSLDVLLKLEGDMNPQNISALNERLWSKVSKADFSNTEFVVSYMIEDDYDANAYSELLNNLHSEGVAVYGKGLHGRHNDETGGIVDWFINRFEHILQNDFGRELKK